MRSQRPSSAWRQTWANNATETLNTPVTPPFLHRLRDPREQVNDSVDSVLRLYKDVVDGVKSVPLLPPSRYVRVSAVFNPHILAAWLAVLCDVYVV